MAHTEERTVRRLTGPPRTEGGGSGSRAAPSTGRLCFSGAPAGRRWKESGKQGRRPGTLPPPPCPCLPHPPERVPASPHPAPQRRRPPWAPPTAALRLGSRAPSSCGRPETPPPGAPPRRARPAPASLLRSRERAPCASRFAAPPALLAARPGAGRPGAGCGLRSPRPCSPRKRQSPAR
uniref:Uncharacterized protein n=1 Tax=Balaenoptera musculus TaxID=9771 RepID=A0A8C0CMF4_BALMU